MLLALAMATASASTAVFADETSSTSSLEKVFDLAIGADGTATDTQSSIPVEVHKANNAAYSTIENGAINTIRGTQTNTLKIKNTTGKKNIRTNPDSGCRCAKLGYG